MPWGLRTNRSLGWASLQTRESPELSESHVLLCEMGIMILTFQVMAKIREGMQMTQPAPSMH